MSRSLAKYGVSVDPQGASSPFIWSLTLSGASLSSGANHTSIATDSAHDLLVELVALTHEQNTAVVINAQHMCARGL